MRVNKDLYVLWIVLLWLSVVVPNKESSLYHDYDLWKKVEANNFERTFSLVESKKRPLAGMVNIYQVAQNTPRKKHTWFCDYQKTGVLNELEDKIFSWKKVPSKKEPLLFETCECTYECPLKKFKATQEAGNKLDRAARFAVFWARMLAKHRFRFKRDTKKSFPGLHARR